MVIRRFLLLYFHENRILHDYGTRTGSAGRRCEIDARTSRPSQTLVSTALPIAPRGRSPTEAGDHARW